MAKTIKGSAIYGEDGTYIFTPYSEGKPENVSWLPLATVTNGKLECSKKKVRVVLTMPRADLNDVILAFTKAFGAIAKKTIDRKVLKLYKAAASEKPCALAKKKQAAKEEEEEEEEEV